jgi:predicted NUDIX family NTP pyrophosphohydrolase
LKQKSGKLIYAWAVESDADASVVKSNTFELEWPPRSGKKISIPEVDKAEWFTAEAAREKILPGQAAFITELEILLSKKKDQ